MEMKLKGGELALIDDEDYPLVSQHRWMIGKSGDRPPKIYVVRYMRNSLTGKMDTLRLHRVILGAVAGQSVDHINGNTLDNRRCNLRFCNDAQNQQNSGPRHGASVFKGVSWSSRRRKWRVAFRCDGTHHFIGYFEHEIDAALAYNTAITALAGEFAYLNQIPALSA